jgi:hypothetical protein
MLYLALFVCIYILVHWVYLLFLFSFLTLYSASLMQLLNDRRNLISADSVLSIGDM